MHGQAGKSIECKVKNGINEEIFMLLKVLLKH